MFHHIAVLTFLCNNCIFVIFFFSFWRKWWVELNSRVQRSLYYYGLTNLSSKRVRNSNFKFWFFQICARIYAYLCLWPKVSKLMKDFKRVQLKLIQHGFEWIWHLKLITAKSLLYLGSIQHYFGASWMTNYNNLHFWLHYRMYGTGKLWPALNFIKIIVNILYYCTKRGK